MIAQRTGRHTITLLLGDWLALGLFVFLGQIDHQLLAIPRLLGTTVLLALPWTIVALATNAYWLPATGGLGAFLRRSLLAWLVAAPLALVARALVQGRATIVVTFMLVTMALGGLFLLAWRATYYTVQARRDAL